jgi:hypothetical protein
MKRKIVIGGVFPSVLMALAMAAQNKSTQNKSSVDKYTVKVPNGLSFSGPRLYRFFALNDTKGGFYAL